MSADQAPKTWGDTVPDAISDERVFASKGCDHGCITIGRDGIHRCLDAIIAAHPDGVGPELAGFYLGLSKQGAEHLFARLVTKVTPRAKLARLGQ